MAYTFPKAGTKAASHVTPHVLECLAQPHRLPTRPEAAAMAKRTCATSKLGMSGLYSMALLANDHVALCYFGSRGGFAQVWDFGPVRKGEAA